MSRAAAIFCCQLLRQVDAQLFQAFRADGGSSMQICNGAVNSFR